jgi:hypothetical protein
MEKGGAEGTQGARRDRDLIVRFGLGLWVEEGQIKVMMALLWEEEERKIDPLV